MLHHPARRAAGAGGVDDAGEVVALEVAAPAAQAATSALLGGDQRGPVVELDIACLARRAAARSPITCSQLFERIAAGSSGLRQLLGRDDHRAGAAVVQDMLVIALGIGDVGGTVTQPAAMIARSEISHSGRFSETSITRSPRSRPEPLQRRRRAARPSPPPRASWSSATRRRSSPRGTARRLSPRRARRTSRRGSGNVRAARIALSRHCAASSTSGTGFLADCAARCHARSGRGRRPRRRG